MDIHYRKQCKRYDFEGQAHCLTFSCYHQQKFFTDERRYGWMLDALALGREKGMYDLWAYVIMPEHVHIVLLPQADIKISSILTTLKQSVAKRALLWIKKNNPSCLDRMADVQPNGKKYFRFWQRGGGYDRNLRSLDDVREKIRYIHRNPVRRKLVASAEQWNWSSNQAWHDGKDDPIAIDRQSLPT